MIIAADDGQTMDYAKFIFWLTIFIPSIVGIMSGTNRSGLLADPVHSIPRGTLSALSLSLILYLLFILYVGGIASTSELNEWGGAKVIVNLAYPLKIFGTIGTILSAISAAIQGIVTAPRLLLAMAKDDVLPWLRPIVTRSGTEPWKCIW
jgi:amino acid transporter